MIFVAVSLVGFDLLLDRFFLESFIPLDDSKKYNHYYMDLRIIYSLQSALLFFIIASPQLYALTGKLFNTKGTPLLLLHSLVFGVVVYLLMRING
jgi:hypothetical protein